LLSINRRSKY